MNNQNQQPNQIPDATQFSPPAAPPTLGVDKPKPESPRVRWLVITVLLLLALGLGWWGWKLWRAWNCSTWPSPCSIDNQQDSSNAYNL